MIPFKSIFMPLAFFISLGVMAAGPGWKHTKEKKISKQYNVAANATLEVSNKYGNVNITTWNQNRVEIEVTITTESNSEKRAEEKLDQIRVDFNGTTNRVSAKTIIDKGYSNWNWGWGDSNVSIKINYQIRMPATNFLILSNDYGAIVLDKLDAKAIIDCDYGSIDIGRLNAADNELSFDYTKRVVIDYVKSAKINADYSDFRIEDAGVLNIHADYTQSEINRADKVVYNADYGGIKLGQVNEVYGNGDYVSQQVDKVTGVLELSSDYGSIRVRSVEPGFSRISINSSYVSVKIGLHPNTNFDIDAKLSYADLKVPDGIDFSRKIIQGRSQTYLGTYGPNPSGKIIIESDYGGVSLSVNE